VIDDAVIKVVLPEGVTNIEVETPFAVERSESVRRSRSPGLSFAFVHTLLTVTPVLLLRRPSSL
jgi:hypothetical protein